MKEYKWYAMKHIALFALAGFLCWYFKSLWGLLVLLFSSSWISNNNGESKNIK
jgi:hypothetical protein